MKPTELEKRVIESMLEDRGLDLTKSIVDFQVVEVADREFTGLGFLTEFERSEALKVGGSGVSLRWGKVGARLNASKIETGYQVYVDDEYITAIEGYTYGDEWPGVVEAMELYELEPGTELLTHPS